jgi:hypothetical protein
MQFRQREVAAIKCAAGHVRHAIGTDRAGAYPFETLDSIGDDRGVVHGIPRFAILDCAAAFRVARAGGNGKRHGNGGASDSPMPRRVRQRCRAHESML